MSIRNLLTSTVSTIDSTFNVVSQSADWATKALSTNRKRWELGEATRTEEYLLELDQRLNEAKAQWVKAQTKYESQVSEEMDKAVEDRLNELKAKYIK